MYIMQNFDFDSKTLTISQTDNEDPISKPSSISSDNLTFVEGLGIIKNLVTYDTNPQATQLGFIPFTITQLSPLFLRYCQPLSVIENYSDPTITVDVFSVKDGIYYYFIFKNCGALDLINGTQTISIASSVNSVTGLHFFYYKNFIVTM